MTAALIINIFQASVISAEPRGQLEARWNIVKRAQILFLLAHRVSFGVVLVNLFFENVDDATIHIFVERLAKVKLRDSVHG